ncbi:S1/P1 nuclease [Candidatus Litorirhabdus singularis]|uniref:S1/P1 nuclease n=1 Tax=Candidatus Litorirhabdus singularis TaxID=2518993 RepID=UPI00243095FE|nr:S1/P1 nuclease [Candidatus Litorirhabdus singularis]
MVSSSWQLGALLACTIGLVLLCTTPALAWGPTGHRVSGNLAEQHLSPAARDGIQQVIGSESLARASTWADEMRSNPSNFWQEVAGPWHYVTVPDGKLYADVGAPQQGDAVSALARFRNILLDPTSSVAQRQLALRFSIHIIADLHQPFHVGNGLDRGGNKIKVRFEGKTTNLHTVWDSKMIKLQEQSVEEWTNTLHARFTATQVKAWLNADPQVWIAESATLRKGLYPQQTSIGRGYTDQHDSVMRQRIFQSGVRIAAYLNDLYKEK